LRLLSLPFVAGAFADRIVSFDFLTYELIHPQTGNPFREFYRASPPESRCHHVPKEEILLSTESRIPRILEQTVDGNGVSAPTYWQPGESVTVPAPFTIEDARRSTNGGGTGLAVETWYLAKKDLAA
jgi:hypothetical protein